MSKKDKYDCPWYPDGKHRNGCGCQPSVPAPNQYEVNRRDKQKQQFTAQQQRVNDEMLKKAAKYVQNNARKRFTTYTPPGTGGMPPGVHMEEEEYKGEKVYRIVLD
jgi:hypothetical protein